MSLFYNSYINIVKSETYKFIEFIDFCLLST